MTYRTSIQLSEANRRFLERIRREASMKLGRSVSKSELVNTVVTKIRKEIEAYEPRVQTTRDGKLSIPVSDWLPAAAEVLVRDQLGGVEGLEQGEGGRVRGGEPAPRDKEEGRR